MRIGIEAQRLLRPHKHGMDIVALRLLEALLRIDPAHEYILFTRPDTDRACLPVADRLTVAEVRAPQYALWEQLALPMAARSYGLDLLHCTANTAPLNPPAPLVLTLHDVLFMDQAARRDSASAYQRFGNRYRSWLVPHLIPRCRRIVTVSEFARRQIIEALPTASDKLTVVHNGVGEAFSRPVADEELSAVKARYHLPDRFYFHLGNTDPRKNTQAVLTAFVQFAATDPAARLVVTGGEPAFVSQWSAADQQCLRERCCFIGYVATPDLPALYRLAEAFLFPSISEGFGLPILEAMACGTPVITATTTSMPEVAGDAALLVDPFKPEAISAALTQLREEGLRTRLITRGLARVSNYSWDAAARRLLTVYQEAIPA